MTYLPQPNVPRTPYYPFGYPFGTMSLQEQNRRNYNVHKGRHPDSNKSTPQVMREVYFVPNGPAYNYPNPHLLPHPFLPHYHPPLVYWIPHPLMAPCQPSMTSISVIKTSPSPKRHSFSALPSPRSQIPSNQEALIQEVDESKANKILGMSLATLARRFKPGKQKSRNTPDSNTINKAPETTVMEELSEERLIPKGLLEE